MDETDFSNYFAGQDAQDALPTFDTEFGTQGGGIDSLQNAIDANAAANFNLDDFMAELQGMGTDLGPASAMGMDQELLDSLGLSDLGNLDAYAADNIDVGGGWNPATGKGDLATAEAAARTGVTGSASVPYGGTTTPGPTLTPGGTDKKTDITTKTGTPGVKTATKSGMDPMTMMMLMMLLSQMGKGGGGSSSQAVIPKLQANRSQLPYSAPSRPGAGGTTYFNPTTYTPAMAGGGEIVMAGGGISSLGSYSDGGRLLKGPGDGVSDGIPATIAGKQPARLANGEFVVPARIVSELGNGSTDAGAQRLYEMMDRVQKARRKTKNVAADTKAHKYLPA